MRDDPDNVPLFDDGLNDEERLKQHAWDCAEAIWSVGRKSVRSYDIKNLMGDLIEWCKPCDLNGEHWTPQRQMDWLKRKVRDRGEAVSLKDLKQMRDDKFNPPSPPANSFAEADRNWKEVQAVAIAQGRCPRCLGEGIKRDGDFCECAEGDAAREQAEREEAEPKPPAQPSLSSLRFDVNLNVHHPSKGRRPAKPTGKDWADTSPTLDRLQSLLRKDVSQWSAKDREFLRRQDKK